MSELVYTAAFVRMGRSPFGSKPKEVAVFAQRLEGGTGLTLFHNLAASAAVLRIRDRGLLDAATLMAGFAISEPRLPLDSEAQAVADRLRNNGIDGELELTSADTKALADAVQGLDIALHITGVGGEVEIDPAAFRDWNVTTAVLEV